MSSEIHRQLNSELCVAPVVNIDLKVQAIGRVCKDSMYPAARPDLWIRICHCLVNST